MKIKFTLLIATCLLAVINSDAQNVFPSSGAAGIGTTTPNASSLLDIVSTTKGILTPRITITQRNAIASPATGLLIFQTNSAPGFYYYNGTAWTAVTPKNKGWALTGNAGTDSSINFIGTTDAHPLVFKVNNQKSGWVDYAAQIGVNPGGNTSFGYQTLYSNTTGSNNTANGFKTLYSNTTGVNNTGYGYQSLYSNTIGNNNTALGYNANVFSLMMGNSNATVIGSNAFANCNNCMVLGSINGVNGATADVNVGIGTSTPTLAKLQINGSVGATVAMFGAEKFGVSIGANNPEVGMNYFYNGATKTIKAGYASVMGMIPATGEFYIGNFNGNQSSADFGSITGYRQNLTLFQNGEFRIAGSSNFSHFYFGVNEDTYIRGGKTNSKVIINDITGGKVGIGMNNPTRAIVEQNGSVGTTAAIFGGDGAGISIQKDWPAIGFNHYYDGSSHRSIGAGFSAQLGVNQNTGSLYLATWNQNAATNANFFLNPTALTQRFFISKSGNMGIGGDNPISDLTIFQSNYTTSYEKIGLRIEGVGDGWNVQIAGAGGLYFAKNGSQESYIANDGSYFQISDMRLKKDINYIKSESVLTKVNLLQPALYLMKDEKEDAPRHYGFIAQQVEPLFPEMVSTHTTKDGEIKMMCYQYFIPVLTKAIQELSIQNDSLKSDNNTLASVNDKQQHQIDNLQTQLNNILQQLSEIKTTQQQCCTNISLCQLTVSSKQSIALNNDVARLEQNAPNPFNNNTIIKYYVPSNISNAQLVISDASGHVLRSNIISNKGAGQITVTANTLSSGSYFYSLIIDGKKVDTKQMVLTK